MNDNSIIKANQAYPSNFVNDKINWS